MKKIILSCAFSLIGAFTFANNNSTEIVEELKEVEAVEDAGFCHTITIEYEVSRVPHFSGMDLVTYQVISFTRCVSN